MLLLLLSSVVATVIVKLPLKDAVEESKTSRVFLFAGSSENMRYPTYLSFFVESARESDLKMKFIICDIEETENYESLLNVTSIPAVVYMEDGIPLASTKNVFSKYAIVSFINLQTYPEIPYLDSEDELKHFKATHGLGVIAATDSASTESLPAFVELNRVHYNEIGVAFASPRLFNEPGFYIYLFSDQSLRKLEDVSNKTFEDLALYLAERSVPSIFKADPFVNRFLASENRSFVHLDLPLGGFYIGSDAAKVAEELVDYCGMNVTFSDTVRDRLAHTVFGLPRNEKGSVSIIDYTTGTLRKYLSREELSVESAKRLCDDFKAGNLRQFNKSAEPSANHGNTREVTTRDLEERRLKNPVVVLGLYYSNDDCLTPLHELAKEASGESILYGQFSVDNNDWPLGSIDTSSLPRVVILKDYVIIAEESMADTKDGLLAQIDRILSLSSEL